MSTTWALRCWNRACLYRGARHLHCRGIPGVDPKYWNIGVRIEDTFVVTENGCRSLSAAAPRTIKEIEQLMKKKAWATSR